jgi:hypothetical protein
LKHFLLAAAILISAAPSLAAQSLDDLNIQIHGYATQAFLYSNVNSWNTTDSEDGSASWTEAVLNLSAHPDPKLRIGVQARFFSLGDYGQAITLDWAQADYKFSDRIGVRFGKVKTPIGLYNETQDIDPAQLWVMLPQSVYPITSRNTVLAHYGAVLYGSLPVGENLGRLEYRAFIGQRVVSADDGYFEAIRDQGITVPNGITGHTGGGTMRWITPVHGLALGASESSGDPSGEIALGSYSGTLSVQQSRQLFYFARYERNRLVLAGEYSRLLALTSIQFAGAPPTKYQNDQRPWYLMATCRVTAKFSAGAYYSDFTDRKAALTPFRFQKDWTLAARYDFNPFLYAKAEQHFLDGTGVGFSAGDNPGIVLNTRLSLLKLGVSF